jgi:hypothetical protein
MEGTLFALTRLIGSSFLIVEEQRRLDLKPFFLAYIMGLFLSSESL